MKEGNMQSGVGVTSKRNVSVRSDRMKGGGDEASKQASTSSAFNKAHTDSKKG